MDKTVYDLASEDTNLHKKTSYEFCGPCPNPNCSRKNDGFVVNIRKNGDAGGFMCRGCWDTKNPPIRPDRPRWGDIIDYYRHFKGMNFTAAQASAKEFLSLQVEDALERVERFSRTALNWKSEQWQERNHALVQTAAKRLTTEPDAQAVLAYLKGRGFSDETINKAHFGAIHSSDVNRLYWARYEVDTWLVVIPWYVDGTLYQIELRDIRPDCPKRERYKTITGSGNGLYLADCLRVKRPTFIVESAFCAVILAQEAGDLVNVVATGSTDGAMISKWAMRIARMPAIFLAQDNEQQGEKAALWWEETLAHKHPIRYRPIIRKDVNEMHLLKSGLVYSWVQAALSFWHEQQIEPVSALVPAQVEDVSQSEQEEQLICSVEGCTVNALEDDRFYFDDSGIPYCGIHGPQAAALVAGDTTSQSEEESLQAFARSVAAIASVFGPDCKIERIDKTLTMRAWLEQQYPDAKIYEPDEYFPVTLPALPRSLCPHVSYEEVNARDASKKPYKTLKAISCSGVPGPSGWCKTHEQISLMLALAAKLGYPQFELSEWSYIGSGVACWEEYATHAMAQVPLANRAALSNNRLREILPRLKSMVDQSEQGGRQQMKPVVVARQMKPDASEDTSQTLESFWDRLHETLERQGYYAMFARDSERAIAHVASYNRLYHPHRLNQQDYEYEPDYEEETVYVL